MAGEHHFKVHVAEVVGVNAAIMLEMFDYWIAKNEANERHFHDGRYWTYNSNKAFTRIYPYMSPKVIRTTLKKLEDEGYIIVGDFNEDRMKRPKWYSITDKGYELLLGEKCPKGQHVLPQRATRAAPEGNSLYIDNSYTFTDSSTSNNGEVAQRDETADSVKAVIAYLNEKTGKHFKNVDSTQKQIRARLNEGYTLEDFKRVIDVKCSQWLKDPKMCLYLRPSTLFGTKFEGYANEAPAKPTKDVSAYGVSSFRRIEVVPGGSDT